MAKLSSYLLATDLSGAYVPIVQGKTKRAAASLFGSQGLPSIKNYGALGDGIANDNAAFVAAAGAGGPIFIPPGDYLTSSQPTALPARMWGDGIVHDGNTNKRGRFFSRLDAQLSTGNEASIETAFNGDFSRCAFPIEHRVYGVDTAGQPGAGYMGRPEVSGLYINSDSTSGWNQATVNNDGRTGIAQIRNRFRHRGGGDFYANWTSGSVGGARAGATSFLANPAAVIVAGNLGAENDGVYLNPLEFLLDDQGHDIAAIGPVVNLKRSNDAGLLNATWHGMRVQSIGSKAINSAFFASGLARAGLDLTALDVSGYNQAAIALLGDQRLYLNAAPDANPVHREPVLSNDYLYYSKALSAAHFVINNQSVLQLYGDQIFAMQPFHVPNTADNGAVNSNSFTGVSDVTANNVGVGTILFKGATSRNSLGFVKFYVGTTPVYVPCFSAITG